MRDDANMMKTVSALNPGVYTDDPPNITVDHSGFESLTFALTIGAGGITFTPANRIDVYLERSDDGVTWDGVLVDMTLPLKGPPFDQNTIPNAGRVMQVNAAHPTPTVHRWGVIDGTQGENRYYRLRADFVGTHGTGTPLAALAILGHPREAPVPNNYP